MARLVQQVLHYEMGWGGGGVNFKGGRTSRVYGGLQTDSEVTILHKPQTSY